MHSLQTIDQKIQDLKLKKQETLKKISAIFLSQASQILGKEFSPELALVILQDAWTDATQDQQEEWRQQVQKFPK
jgi:hypothetical protein